MKAAIRRKYGPPENITFEDVEKPKIGDTDILIRVKFSSVNRTDCGFLRAKPFVTRFFSGLINPRQPILGCEFAGEVCEIGDNVTEFKVGDKVFGFDDAGWGGHGEFKKINQAKSVAKMPEGISFEQAAASTEGAHYALSYIDTIKKLGAKNILVHGATGSIGSAAVQLLKQAGFTVVATSTTKNVELVKSLEADKVIDWQTTDFTKCGLKFDVVFDAVGKSSFKDCKPLLNDGGAYIATELGPYIQNPWLGLVSPFYRFFSQKFVLFPLPKNNKQLIEFIADRLADGSYIPVIDKTYRLEGISKAYKYVETGQKTGNVVIQL
jgi:NADPH:quinone reductase-like Zn-dependent oxidoreductase